MLQGPPPLSDVGRGCQDMLRWSGQNANQKVGPDKMPTMEKKSRTKCQPRLAFCPVGILSGWHLVLPPVGGGGARTGEQFLPLPIWGKTDNCVCCTSAIRRSAWKWKVAAALLNLKQCDSIEERSKNQTNHLDSLFSQRKGRSMSSTWIQS